MLRFRIQSVMSMIKASSAAGSVHLKAGKLYGVSVGPGDPELMTLKAVQTIERCPVVAAPRTRGAHTLALDIAQAALDISQKEILFLDFEMGAADDDRTAMYRAAAEELMERLDGGKDVSLLNLGDASVYGTWSYVEQVARDAGYTCETVPGVTSFSATAAKLHTSLTKAQLPLRIIPGSYEQLERELELPGTKVIMKAGRALSDIAQVIDQMGLHEHASMVVDCGLEGERVLEKMEVTGDEGYFVTILVDDVSH